MNKETIEIGDYDLEDATPLDDYAYALYCFYIKSDPLFDTQRYLFYTQKGFQNSVGSEEIYKEAKQTLRKQKIKKLKNL